MNLPGSSGRGFGTERPTYSGETVMGGERLTNPGLL